VVRLLLFLVIGGAFVAVLFFTTQSESTVECSVCVDFEGRSACRTVLAATRDEALAGAVRNACAVLSSGVTRRLECDRQPPRSVECSE
jgi:hypothetical protein